MEPGVHACLVGRIRRDLACSKQRGYLSFVPGHLQIGKTRYPGIWFDIIKNIHLVKRHLGVCTCTLSYVRSTSCRITLRISRSAKYCCHGFFIVRVSFNNATKVLYWTYILAKCERVVICHIVRLLGHSSCGLVNVSIFEIAVSLSLFCLHSRPGREIHRRKIFHKNLGNKFYLSNKKGKEEGMERGDIYLPAHWAQSRLADLGCYRLLPQRVCRELRVSKDCVPFLPATWLLKVKFTNWIEGSSTSLTAVDRPPLKRTRKTEREKCHARGDTCQNCPPGAPTLTRF